MSIYNFILNSCKLLQCSLRQLFKVKILNDAGVSVLTRGWILLSNPSRGWMKISNSHYFGISNKKIPIFERKTLPADTEIFLLLINVWIGSILSTVDSTTRCWELLASIRDCIFSTSVRQNIVFFCFKNQYFLSSCPSELFFVTPKVWTGSLHVI